jgi:hypothetical protein
MQPGCRPTDFLAIGDAHREKFGPRGVIQSWAQADGTQKIEDTGPLTQKRMKTIDDVTPDRAIEFIKEDLLDGYTSKALNRESKIHLDGYDISRPIVDSSQYSQYGFFLC